MEFNLRDYQKEVVQPALRGYNVIIWLPTGSGKTRAAVYVVRNHLEKKTKAKVAVLVNKIHLVDQHFNKEFQPFLKDKFKVVAISGDSEEKMFFSHVVKENDVIICTAQILENALSNMEEEKHVELSDFSLLVFDECHHTHKESVYNKIMTRYLEMKLSRNGSLPQILGLTASPGTGGNTSFEKAKEHILQICANLDAMGIMSPEINFEELQENVPQPIKKYDVTEERPEDPFGDALKEMMKMIGRYLDHPNLPHELGSQIYEQAVVELEKTGAVAGDRKMRVCAIHLRKYNDSLMINDTVRMIDALSFLDEFFQKEKEKKRLLDGHDDFVFQVYEDYQPILSELAKVPDFENPKLEKLEKILLTKFQASKESRGIIFTKTRMSTYCLADWIKKNRKLQETGIKVSNLTGSGISNQTKHMTQNEQRDVIAKFRQGDLNLLVATSVAEEGLDIKECNVVVRYGLMTNEIAMVQARGRARAEDSVYSVVAKQGGKEIRREFTNEYLEELTKQVIKDIQQMPKEEYREKIKELQMESVISRKLKMEENERKRQVFKPTEVIIYCRNCTTAVCFGSDMRLIENMHHVNINPDFKIYYERSGGNVPIPKKFEDWEPGPAIKCANCGQEWGMEMIYKSVTLPILSIKKFVVEMLNKEKSEKKSYRQWKDVPFTIEEFDYVDYCQNNFPEVSFDSA
ncbi:probable ATP-dependent RNA helicase DHX58 [Protopterus annectens]|uniref:probable ATP-dependent RNA helicase DHX58 n=1 Tax=Protopterus annectens TaxID=7888 RepID=UPI001CFA6743|nr:probable ATP-dependent RNA helicase DHX58 [Protopterus annectens]